MNDAEENTAGSTGSTAGIAGSAEVLAREARALLDALRDEDDPELAFDQAAFRALAEPLVRAFDDLAASCELLAGAEPHSIHRGPLDRSSEALRSLARSWGTIRLNAGCHGVG
ncbi:hypothetical protein ABZZ04_09185 [Streptomyces sp. NPDC006435]|uniref:hypothetical protein n=1 Tax=Streptomyces sp. NPDC006435 TaxID=3154300 RepID=UPI00339E4926